MPETPVPVKSTNGIAPRRTEPFAWFDDFANEMERFWSRPFSFFTGPARAFAPAARTESVAWVPRVDVFEKDGAVIIKAELPGLKKEDVQVEVVGDELIISGQTKAETEVKDEDYYRSERRFGSFYRRMPMPAGVTPEQIDAKLTDGVLEVRMPQPAQARGASTKIPVS